MKLRLKGLLALKTIKVIDMNRIFGKCQTCNIERKFIGFFNNYQGKLIPLILCNCPHYEFGVTLLTSCEVCHKEIGKHTKHEIELCEKDFSNNRIIEDGV